MGGVEVLAESFQITQIGKGGIILVCLERILGIQLYRKLVLQERLLEREVHLPGMSEHIGVSEISFCLPINVRIERESCGKLESVAPYHIEKRFVL